jgi:hypothetical protein
MKTPSRLVFGERDQGSDNEAEIPRATGEDIRRRLRRTCIAIRRNQFELEAIRSQLGAEIRSLEQHRMIARLAGLRLTAPDAGLRRAAGELLELLETQQSPDARGPVRPSVKATVPERRNAL